MATSSRKKVKSTKITVKSSSDTGGSDEQISYVKSDVKAKGRAKGVKVESELGSGDLTSLPSDVETSDSDSSGSEEDWENCLQTIAPGASGAKHEAPLGDLEVTLEPNKAQLWS